MSCKHWLAALMSMFGLSACATQTPLPLASHVDIERFMGRWYVIAHIPTWIEKQSYNAVESYALKPDGSIATTFTFNEGGIHGPMKVYHPTGFVIEGSGNALWGMQFVWPIKAQYKISHVADDYSNTIVTRDKLDYVWIMARTPSISEQDYQQLRGLVESYGYDMSKLRRVPQMERPRETP
ncbi:lipocalin family protein [Methylobacillus methanolivorans]|uniref:Outer membrane lipoprotein Blc n=1 Tax=Methylobacillus methanolivorans TaxID=1848927 RepID=A0ABW8GMW0_9PROT